MNEITLHEVKNILRDKVKQTIKHINHYDSDTNKYDEEVLNERIHQSSEKDGEPVSDFGDSVGSRFPK